MIKTSALKEGKQTQGHTDTESEFTEVREVRITMDKEEQNIKEKELKVEIHDEMKKHCTPVTQTRHTSLILED